MISLRKLASLPPGTRRHKSLRLIRDCESCSSSGQRLDSVYMKGLLELILADDSWPEQLREKVNQILAVLSQNPSSSIARELNSLRHCMLTALGRSWADWDAESPRDGFPDAETAKPGGNWPIRVYLDGLRSPFNVGSIARSAQAFGAERMWLSPDCVSLNHRRAQRSAMWFEEGVPWSVCEMNQLTSGERGTVFALELGGTEITEFQFPESGTVVLGSEELGVSPSLMEEAVSDGGVVSLPLSGPKASLNVGVAFGILIQRWTEFLGGR